MNGSGSKEFPLSDKLSLKVVLIRDRRRYKTTQGDVIQSHVRIKLTDYPRPNHGFLPKEFNDMVDRLNEVRDEINRDLKEKPAVIGVQNR